ncbi:MAG: molybdate ABC transporter substrate-binding protein [Eubacterium sp.]|nr:molybdate ABC transporter substrate-binding protein [Eubacterium sp.]
MKKRVISLTMAAVLAASVFAGCGAGGQKEAVTVYVDAAASLKTSIEEIIPLFNKANPNVTISLNTGSSGTLLTQIEESEGIDHDVFFSAGAKQVDTLDEKDNLMLEGTRVDLLSNQLCLVKPKGGETAVAGWENLEDAKNMALCDGTVPVGKYTRNALVSLGYLPESEDNSAYTSEEVSAALGGVEINECADVTAAAQSVAEKSNEIGTIYYSDYYDFTDNLEIIAQDDGTLTGPIIYPVCQVINSKASEAQTAAAKKFAEFLRSDEALKVFEKHCFIINK